MTRYVDDFEPVLLDADMDGGGVTSAAVAVSMENAGTSLYFGVGGGVWEDERGI